MGKVSETLIKSKKVRIYPNQKQKRFIRHNFRCNMFVWNNYFNMIESDYKHKKEYLQKHEKEMTDKEIKEFKKKMFPSYYDLTKILTALKKHFAWLYEGESTSYQYSIKYLHRAYINMFKGNAQHPKRKKLNKSYTCSIPNTIKSKFIDFQKHLIQINKVGKVFYSTSNNFNINLLQAKNFTITENNLGKFYLSVAYEYEDKNININKISTEKSIGIDMGITDLMILSNGEKIPYINFDKITYKLHQQMKIMSRRLLLAKERIKKFNQEHYYDTKEKMTLEDCMNYQKQKHTVGKIKKQIAHKREDYIHKITDKLTDKFDLIVIENLKSANMMKNHHLAKSISNASWFSIRTMLQYKCDEKGKTLLIVPPRNTSRICSSCGYNSGAKPLNIRVWTCPNCQVTLDRDINASKNILKRGLKTIENN